MKLSLTKEDFITAAQTANLITVSTELTMDLDTPVSIYYKLVGDKKGYIMESVDTTQQQFGRYSFIGGEPFVNIQVFADKLLVNENGLMKSIEGVPHETIKTYAARFMPATANGESLPLVHGGLAGYFSYETAATFDRVRGVELGGEQLLGQFMMCRYLVVYDALRNSAQLHYLADIHTGEDVDELYDTIMERLTAMCKRLATPFAPPPRQRRNAAPPWTLWRSMGPPPLTFSRPSTQSRNTSTRATSFRRCRPSVSVQRSRALHSFSIAACGRSTPLLICSTTTSVR